MKTIAPESSVGQTLAASAQPNENAIRQLASKAGHFIVHFIEMCLAMCLGGIPLIVLFFFGAAQVGYPDLLQRFPELSVLVVSLILTLPMIVWMRFRGHAWRATLEMASTTMILGTGLIVLGQLGILRKGDMFEWLTRLACPAMIIPMLFRLDLYTGHHHAGRQHLAHAGGSDPEKPCH